MGYQSPDAEIRAFEEAFKLTAYCAFPYANGYFCHNRAVIFKNNEARCIDHQYEPTGEDDR